LWALVPPQTIAQGEGAKNLSPTKDESAKLYAEKKYSEVVRLLSGKIEALNKWELIRLGNSYCGLKNHTLALKTFTVFLGRHPDDKDAKTFVAREQIHLGNDREALNLIKEVLEKDKHYAPAYKIGVEIYKNRNDRYELRQLYLDMIKNLGEKPEFVTKVCELSSLEGLFEMSVSYCQRGISLNPKEPSNYVYLGLTYKETKEPEKAMRYLKQAADSFPKSEIANLTMGRYFEEAKNYTDSYKYFGIAAKFNPQSLDAQLAVGRVAIEVQKFSESLQAFKMACNLNKSAVTALRSAANQLRLLKSTWLGKFELEIEKCGLGSKS
jgi:tetratricopeptide (TPR) repeat protein